MNSNDPRVAEAIRILETGGQRQDSLTDQLVDAYALMRAGGMDDALEYFRKAIDGHEHP